MPFNKLDLRIQGVVQANVRQGRNEDVEEVLLGISKPTGIGVDRRENIVHARRNQLQNIIDRGIEKDKKAGEYTGRRTALRFVVGRPRDKPALRL